MGRIKFLNIIYDQSIGGSRMTNKFTNLSEDKMNHRLVLKLELIFNDGTILPCVIKITSLDNIHCKIEFKKKG